MTRNVKPFTAAVLRIFDRLTMDASSRDQMERISARLRLRTFMGEHGKEKCDAMMEEIRRRERSATTRKGEG